MLRLAIAVIGAGGIAAQTVLTRELLVVFLGNELTLGIILGAWMLCEASGAFLIGRLSDKVKDTGVLVSWLMAGFTAAMALSVLAARSFKSLAGAAPGEGLGTGIIIAGSFLIMLGPAFCHGGLFAAANAFIKPSLTYVIETAGTLAGGLILTFWLIPSYSHFEIVLWTGALSAGICVFFLKNVRNAIHRAVLSAVIISSVFCCVSIDPVKLEQFSLARQYPSGKVLAYKNSSYGNAVVTQKDGQRVFFYNGVPSVITPVPEAGFLKEFAHLPMAFCDTARNSLVIGAGLGGLVGEILRSPVASLDYCQQDPVMIKLLWKYPSSITSKELSDKRVRIAHEDPRIFLKNGVKSYDIVYIGTDTPSDLVSNRFFTEEFFALVHSRLTPSGVAALSLPGSAAYLSPETRDMNYTVINALKRSFARVRVIPGDRNIIIASDQADLSVKPQAVYKKISARRVNSGLLNPSYLQYRLGDNWSSWFIRSSEGHTDLVNRDDQPAAVYQVLLSWNKRFSRLTMAGLHALSGLRLWMVLVLSALIAGFFLAALRVLKRNSLNIAVLGSVLTTGYFGMAMNLLLLYSFQISHGHVYKTIGALTALFMAGAALGAGAAGAVRDKSQNIKILSLAGLEWASALFCAVVIFALSGARLSEYSAAVHWILFAGSGFLTGAQFPLGVWLYSSGKGSDPSRAGTVFCADLVGGVAASFTAGVVLLPLLGIERTLVALLVLKCVSASGVTLLKNIK